MEEAYYDADGNRIYKFGDGEWSYEDPSTKPLSGAALAQDIYNRTGKNVQQTMEEARAAFERSGIRDAYPGVTFEKYLDLHGINPIDVDGTAWASYPTKEFNWGLGTQTNFGEFLKYSGMVLGAMGGLNSLGWLGGDSLAGLAGDFGANIGGGALEGLAGDFGANIGTSAINAAGEGGGFLDAVTNAAGDSVVQGAGKTALQQALESANIANNPAISIAENSTPLQQALSGSNATLGTTGVSALSNLANLGTSTGMPVSNPQSMVDATSAATTEAAMAGPTATYPTGSAAGSGVAASSIPSWANSILQGISDPKMQTALGSLFGMIDAYDKQNALTGAANTAASMSDPFAGQRPFYQGQLKDIYTNPNYLNTTPWYQGLRDTTVNDVSRSMAARGYNMSSNEIKGLGTELQNRSFQYLQPWTQMTGTFAGGTSGPGNAGAVYQQGATNAANAGTQAAGNLGVLFQQLPWKDIFKG